jgi:aspartyl-tRNA(Asn)/glutamyl-tRNA(Gln) amidotransferase subunit C
LGNHRCIIAAASAGDYPDRAQQHQSEDDAVALSKQEIEYIAHLARLEVTAAELPAYAGKLSKIIDFIDELGAADTGDLLPMAHPLDMSQRLRVDEVTETNERDCYQTNAPETSEGLYVVPRVVE